MENKPTATSRLKPPTRIALPVGMGAPTSALQELPTNARLAFSRRPNLSRRSKSFSDLSTVHKPLKPLGPNIMKKFGTAMTTRAPIAKPAVKPILGSSSMASRKRANEQKPDTVTNPKVARPAKPAAYDYKARFNLLNEKHTTLVTNNKDLKQQMSVTTAANDALKEKYTSEHGQLQQLQINFAKLEEDCKQLQRDYTGCLDVIKKLNNQKLVLEETVSKIQREMSILQTELSDLKGIAAEKAQLEATLEQTQREYGELETKFTFAKSALNDEQTQRRYLLNMVQDLKGNIRVLCRVRPPLEGEHDQELNIGFIDETSMELRKSKESISSTSGRAVDFKQEFTFDRIYSQNSSQFEVFLDLVQLIQSAVDGYHICIFAYGQTGSGKTYTMQGDEKNLGMIPRSIDLLFDTIEQMKPRGWSYEIHACFLEIYNENIVDLLNPDSHKTHEIRHNEGKGTTVTNLLQVPIDSPAGLYELMYTAQTNRRVAATNYNEHSSRSHAITKIILRGRQEESDIILEGSINLVDLAGSESAKTSGVERIAETKYINKSLSALGNVMLALYNGDTHIPYRNSKLTYLLQSCLGGNSKTLMVINISPFENCYNETINSLRFGAKVKEVKTSSKRNRVFK